MKPELSKWVVVSGLLMTSTAAMGDSLPPGYWSTEQAEAVLEKTLEVRLEADLAALSPGEAEAVEHLLVAGDILNRLYERQRHLEAERALDALRALHRRHTAPALTQKLLDLFWIFKGPVATTLDNERQTFLPVDEERPGKNVYPWGAEKSEFEQIFAAQPEPRSALLHLRSVVRRDSTENRALDRATLERHPALATHHPEFAQRVAGPVAGPFYAVPYAIAYADELAEAYVLLRAAASALESDDPEFARYLRHRGRDLLSGDYESGDASWVTGAFGNLNAQLGSYETYDDALFGVKAFYGASLLIRDAARSTALAGALGSIQAIEDSLPYERHKRVRDGIPVGVYNVIADFGQARGTNTATILPNEAEHARKYGRTILLRYNVLTHPELFELAHQRFVAALAPEFHSHLTLEAGFERTLWHEIGHYLGVSETEGGEDLGEALQESSDLLEEMKSDLVSLYAARQLRDLGYYDDDALRGVYASGVLRVLQAVKPRRAQPYQTMQLMQWNYFLEHGLLTFDRTAGVLSIDYARYHEVVSGLLAKVLAIQNAGEPELAKGFVDQYFLWRDDLHETIAERIRAATPYRFRRVRYSVMDE